VDSNRDGLSKKLTTV